MIDAEEFLFHRGRADGAILRGGFKLLPETIERALLLHPAVSAVAVVGLSDTRLGQVPAAVVQFKRAAVEPSHRRARAASARPRLRDAYPGGVARRGGVAPYGVVQGRSPSRTGSVRARAPPANDRGTEYSLFVRGADVIGRALACALSSRLRRSRLSSVAGCRFSASPADPYAGALPSATSARRWRPGNGRLN